MNTEPDLSTLTNRLNYILQITGTKKADLARAIDVKPQIIQFLCNSQTKASRFTFEIATALGLNTLWLATGEGAMFIADDLEQQFLKEFKKIPLFTNEALLQSIGKKKPLSDTSIEGFLPLKTTSNRVFAIKMADSSMEPYLPNGAFIFIEETVPYIPKEKDFVFAYLYQFNTFVVRQIGENTSGLILAPKNTELFKEIVITHDTLIIGAVTDCFWNLRS